MKFWFTLILLVLTINLVIISSVKSTKSERRVKSKFLRVKHHSRSQFTQADTDCGCKITYSYFEGPKVLKKKPYKRRWPLPKPIEKPEPPKKEPTTCNPGDGGALLIKLRKLFPPPITHRKPKKHSTSSKGGVTVVTVSSSSSSASSTPPQGKFTKQIYELANNFREKIRADEKAAAGLPRKKTKLYPRKKLTPEEKEKKAMEERKEVVLKMGRRKCYSRIRQYLQSQYKIPYKGKKCHIIGRLLFTCLTLA